MSWLLVLAGGMVGAPLRYLSDRAIQARHDSVFPWGTFTVNVIGCLLMGFLVGLSAADPVTWLLATGLCGALTTYSTFSYETLRLVETGARLMAVLNVTASVVVGVGAAFAGYAIA